ncbi:MAG: hypothetical protein ACK5CM_01900, partial [Pseudanabaena sp.]
MQKVKAHVKVWTRSLAAVSLVAMIVFGGAHEAFAKRSGGRIGGSSFKSAPSRSAPSNSGYSGSSSNHNFGGGGIPFIFWGGGGGGGLFTILL